MLDLGFSSQRLSPSFNSAKGATDTSHCLSVHIKLRAFYSLVRAAELMKWQHCYRWLEAHSEPPSVITWTFGDVWRTLIDWLGTTFTLSHKHYLHIPLICVLHCPRHFKDCIPCSETLRSTESCLSLNLVNSFFLFGVIRARILLLFSMQWLIATGWSLNFDRSCMRRGIGHVHFL